jgi:hypothetical protein
VSLKFTFWVKMVKTKAPQEKNIQVVVRCRWVEIEFLLTLEIVSF